MTILKNLDLITDHSTVEINMCDEILKSCPPIWKLNEQHNLETFNLELWNQAVASASGSLFLSNDVLHCQFGSTFEYTLNIFSRFHIEHDFLLALKFAGFHRQLKKDVVVIFPLYLHGVGNYKHINLDNIFSDMESMHLVNTMVFSINEGTDPLKHQDINIEFSNHHITNL